MSVLRGSSSALSWPQTSFCRRTRRVQSCSWWSFQETPRCFQMPLQSYVVTVALICLDVLSAPSVQEIIASIAARHKVSTRLLDDLVPLLISSERFKRISMKYAPGTRASLGVKTRCSSRRVLHGMHHVCVRLCMESVLQECSIWCLLLVSNLEDHNLLKEQVGTLSFSACHFSSLNFGKEFRHFLG